MPTSKDAIKRHIMYCLTAAETANNFYLDEKTREKGVKVFDGIREQVDLAMKRSEQLIPTNETDIILARFVDAVSQIGMIRYSVQGTLIPLAKQKLLAAQRLGWKDLESDSLDGLGILYAFLGYLQQAIRYFEMALKIAGITGNKELTRDIRAHLKMAQKQMVSRKPSSILKVPSFFRLILFRMKVFVAKIYKNPFSQVAALNKLAGIYLDHQKWDLSISYYQQAIEISRALSYRFGELEATMGLLQAEMSKDPGAGDLSPTNTIGNYVSEFGFEWSTDYSVFETLLEIAPAIRNIEIILGQLRRKKDPRAERILGLLDQIMAQTGEIVSTAARNPNLKNEIFMDALTVIRNGLSNITTILSSQNQEHE